jgi:adenosylcobyric acid synthase
MNPVLLKPCGDTTSQVIVNGSIRATLNAREYYAFRHTLKTELMQSFRLLAEGCDLILIEGAGSPAEINLRENDIANMGMAEMADAPVLLVGDIDRGGVFASLFGTVKLLEPAEQRRIRGFIINKFRGDLEILAPGLRDLEYILARPVLGVLPWLDVRIDEEDSLTERLSGNREHGNAREADLDIAVIRLPRISNFTDFAVFDSMPDVCLRYVDTARALGGPDLLIIPGSKNTLRDMLYLRERGFEPRILALHRDGTPIFGICGGFQMLGRAIRDPQGMESALGSIQGLGLLEMDTVFAPHKRTTQTRAAIAPEAEGTALLHGTAGMPLVGYEIHMGQSAILSGSSALPLSRREDGSPEGMIGSGGKVFGTYLHGIFDNIPFTRTLLNNLRIAKGLAPLPPPPGEQGGRTYTDFKQSQYDLLADQVEACLDMEGLERIINT